MRASQFRLRTVIALLLILSVWTARPAAAALTYTCDPSVPAQVCQTLQTTIAGLYNSTFTNIVADDYVTMGSTGLGENTQSVNLATYSQYLTRLIAQDGQGTVRADAITSLEAGSSAHSLYGGGDVVLTAALATSLGFTGAEGITATGGTCLIGASGCYDGVITISNTASLYDRIGQQAAGSYDIYSVVEHETDETLGTVSCIGTTTGSLVDDCGGSTPSAVDLFRCEGSSHVLIDSTAGAYFSYNGCQTNGADGAVYNTLANGDDYADFVDSSPCQSVLLIQDAVGCPGYGGGLDITNDGPGGTSGPEITILDALGYNLAPEPMSVLLFAPGVIGLLAARRRRAAA